MLIQSSDAGSGNYSISIPSITTTTNVTWSTAWTPPGTINISDEIVKEIIKLASTESVKIGFKKLHVDWSTQTNGDKYPLYDNDMTDIGFIFITATKIEFVGPDIVWPDTLEDLECDLGDPKAIEKIAQHIKSKYNTSKPNIKHSFTKSEIITYFITIVICLIVGFTLAMVYNA